MLFKNGTELSQLLGVREDWGLQRCLRGQGEVGKGARDAAPEGHDSPRGRGAPNTGCTLDSLCYPLNLCLTSTLGLECSSSLDVRHHV